MNNIIFLLLVSLSITVCYSASEDQKGREIVLSDYPQIFTFMYENDYQKVKDLIKDTSQFKKTGPFGMTPLMASIRLQNYDIFKLLLKEGANINDSGKFGSSPIFEAFFTRQRLIIKNLIENPKLDLKQKDEIGDTIFLWAASWGDLDNLKYLIEKRGINVYERSKSPPVSNATGLHMAVLKGKLDIVNYFLKKKIYNIDDQNNSESLTPLHIACYRGHHKIKELLLKHKANEALKDKKGRRALDYCNMNR